VRGPGAPPECGWLLGQCSACGCGRGGCQPPCRCSRRAAARHSGSGQWPSAQRPAPSRQQAADGLRWGRSRQPRDQWAAVTSQGPQVGTWRRASLPCTRRHLHPGLPRRRLLLCLTVGRRHAHIKRLWPLPQLPGQRLPADRRWALARAHGCFNARRLLCAPTSQCRAPRRAQPAMCWPAVHALVGVPCPPAQLAGPRTPSAPAPSTPRLPALPAPAPPPTHPYSPADRTAQVPCPTGSTVDLADLYPDNFRQGVITCPDNSAM
jgi:hypothetical protein